MICGSVSYLSLAHTPPKGITTSCQYNEGEDLPQVRYGQSRGGGVANEHAKMAEEPSCRIKGDDR